MDFHHISVLYDEVLDLLAPKNGEVFVDGTVGGGGHSFGLLEKLMPDGKLLAIDQDEIALLAAKERLAIYGNSVKLIHSNYEQLPNLINTYYPEGVDGILLDIGVSSPQLDDATRGFSYMKNAALDMRMNKSQSLDAYQLINTYSLDALYEIIKNYGEEKWSKRIAELIIERRAIAPIETTLDLVDVIERAIPKGAREKGSHVAKRTFQAIRIAVNDELGVLERVIDGAIDALKKGGRMGIITFHSLEDRIVKNKFKYHTLACVCPSEAPFCTCNKVQTVKLLTRKPLVAKAEEVAKNPRAKSAKLRVIEKII